MRQRVRRDPGAGIRQGEHHRSLRRLRAHLHPDLPATVQRFARVLQQVDEHLLQLPAAG